MILPQKLTTFRVVNPRLSMEKRRPHSPFDERSNAISSWPRFRRFFRQKMALWGVFLGDRLDLRNIDSNCFATFRYSKASKKKRMVERSLVFVRHYNCFLLHRFFRNTCEVPNVHFDLQAPGRIGQNSHCRKMTWHHLANDSLHLCEMRYFGFMDLILPQKPSNSSRNFGFFPFSEHFQNKQKKIYRTNIYI